MKTNVCYLGGCLSILPTLPDNSIDSIVTDPPYELGFMGKSWDNSGIAYSVPMWKECLRVLKPGGHLLSFSGTRTYHRMAVAIEDAGFEVRDMIEWVYGSGFPKSLNIGKAVDKLQGNEREVVGELKLTGTARNTKTIGAKTSSALTSDYEINNTKTDITKGTSEWEGWGTALKPAHEPICLARKPLEEKTVAENVLKYGTGGINIDESRVVTDENLGRQQYSKTSALKCSNYKDEFVDPSNGLGRFPANLILDNSEEVRECFPEQKSGARSSKHQIGNKDGEMFNHGIYGKYKAKNYDDVPADSGNASRFFKSILYYPKASKSERNKGCDELEEVELRGGGGRAEQGYDDNDPEQQRLKDAAQAYGAVKAKKSNFHPTVKPIALMEYLIKMITPKGGIVLDPFAGSGSTLVAARDNGFNYIGIEMTEEYLPIIQARTGCEIIKQINKIKKVREVNNQIIKEVKIKSKINICPACGGKIKGKYCEDCLEEYN